MSVNLVSSLIFFQMMFDCVDAAVPARKASRESLVTSCDRVLCAFRGQALASFLRPKKKLSVAIRFHGSIVDMNMSASV